MSKKLITLFAFLMAFSIIKAQFTYQGVFPPPSPDTLKFQTHGMAVDPDGKVWVNSYSKLDSVFTAGGVKVLVSAIYVYNADGTPASFSPIRILTKDGVSDTLKGNGRGMGVDKDGNVLHSQSGPNMLYKINYLTGELMAKATMPSSPTAAMGDANGNIYCACVVPGNPLIMFDSDLNVLLNGIDATVGYSRAFAISSDGNTVYWAGYDKGNIKVYTRASEFDQFALADSIAEGAKAESFNWDKKNKSLWFSAGSVNDPPFNMFTKGSWYAYDFANKTVIDSFKLNFGSYSLEARPRAIVFSNDGNTAYVGTFGVAGFPAVQVFTRDITPTSVTFNVNMSVQITNSTFDPATGHVYVAGSFTDWGTSQLEMTDPDADKIYSVTVPNLEPGTRTSFKYRNGEGWENDPNREYVVVPNGSYTDYYDRDLGGGIPITLIFECNMELEIVAGRFNPSTDVLSARGTFNGWSGDATIMTPSITNPTTYEGVASASLLADDVIKYKFAYVTTAGTTWENGDDVAYTVTTGDINAGMIALSHSFNNANLQNVTHQATVIRISVNMANAVNAITVQPFPTIENVFVCGAVTPLIWPDGGWPNADSLKAIFLNDSGLNGDLVAGDGLWSKEITFPQYTLTSFQFKFGANWGLPSNGGSNDNESSTGVNHSFVDIPNEATYVEAPCVWADMSPCPFTGVEKENDNLPSTYSLEQNYPNPFNPSTTINFSIPQAGLVTLKVYDLLGQEVASLVNDELAAGNYNVNFNASSLTSGIYFYSVTSNNFVATKKMMLIK
ncbi:MAG: T9SS type A sorting domain-containing protein [bacterium]